MKINMNYSIDNVMPWWLSTSFIIFMYIMFFPIGIYLTLKRSKFVGNPNPGINFKVCGCLFVINGLISFIMKPGFEKIVPVCIGAALIYTGIKKKKTFVNEVSAQLLKTQMQPEEEPKKVFYENSEIVVECKGCGANNKVLKGSIGTCEFCGSPIGVNP